MIVYLQYKPLDSLHLAAAIENACGKFLTNDAGLSGFPDLTVRVHHQERKSD
jgi:predicted nucleic acid-binding protein